MEDEKRAMGYVEIYRAPRHLKYDHTKPGGAVQIIYCIFSVLLLLFLQHGFFSMGSFQINGQSPNLVLVFIYLVSVKCKPRRAVLLGLLSGLALDIFYGRYVGLYAILLMYTALAAALLSDKLLNSKWRIVAAGIPLFLLFRVTESFAGRLLSLALGGGTCLYTDYIRHFTGAVLPCVLFNELCLAAMIFPVYALWRRCSPH